MWNRIDESQIRGSDSAPACLGSVAAQLQVIEGGLCSRCLGSSFPLPLFAVLVRFAFVLAPFDDCGCTIARNYTKRMREGWWRRQRKRGKGWECDWGCAWICSDHNDLTWQALAHSWTNDFGMIVILKLSDLATSRSEVWWADQIEDHDCRVQRTLACVNSAALSGDFGFFDVQKSIFLIGPK